ncbi:MAG: O-antigen ligase family protein [Cyanobacteriota bacterium]
MKPQNLEEKIVWYYITGTYVLYLLGLQHFLAPLLAWGLGFYVCKKLWNQTDETPEEDKISIPFGVWVWIVFALAMQVITIVNHLDFDMGLTRIIKSTINFWAKNWALFAMFPLIGSCLKIRPQLLYRAASILGLQSLILTPISTLASRLHLPQILYTSPLYKVGAAGEVPYSVYLYGSQADTEEVRLFLFAPWAPALALVGCVYFFLSSKDPDKRWRWIGMISYAVVVFATASRLGTLVMVVIPAAIWGLSNLTNPKLQITAGVFSVFAGYFGQQLVTALKDVKDSLDAQRSGSSQVRAMLARMARDRWQREAPIWGHGLSDERGPYVVAFKPIGTHHMWFGVLYTHGLVGFIALATAMSLTLIELLIKAQKSQVAEVGLSVLLVLAAFSIGENLDGLIYLFWPGMVIIGMAFKEKMPGFYSE